MSLIQKIRDKYARVAVIAIGVALLGFLLMDALGSRGSGGGDNTLGKINGKKIEYDAFNRKVDAIQKRQGGQAADATQQIVTYLWQQELDNVIMGEQYKELGLTVTDKEMDALMFAANPSPLIRQAFGNPEQWDPAALRTRITQIRKTGTTQEREQLTEIENSIKSQTMAAKYNSLLANSVYIPKWFLQKRSADNAQMAKASYIGVPYSTIADSTVKVSDAEISDYMKAHKKDFDQKEESRAISYVIFSASPSSTDSAAVRNTLLGMRDSFARTNDAKEFLINNRSQIQYNDQWISQTDMQLQNGDSIFKAPVGTVVGPLVESGLLVMTKVTDRKTQPDTAKVRHILIATEKRDPQTGQSSPLRDSATAKRIADSVRTAIAAGSPFDSVLVKLSDDRNQATGVVNNNGVYDSITRNAQFVQEFKDFALNNPVGTKGVVKTDFGYHYMEVLNQRGTSDVVKLAVFALPIDASSETQSTASNDAAMLAGNAKDPKSFDDYFEKNLKSKGFNKLLAPSLKPMDFNVNGINGSARELVKTVFKADKGDVLNPVTLGSNYIVAVVTEVNEPGLPSASSVRPQVEPILVNKKKADKIKQQMGTITDLNTVAGKFQQQVQSADSIRFSGGNVLGYESKVIGAMFNPANKGKVCPEGIAGTMGVYAIRVDNTFAGPADSQGIEEQRKMMEMQSRQQQQQQPLDILQKRANVKDYRAKFY